MEGRRFHSDRKYSDFFPNSSDSLPIDAFLKFRSVMHFSLDSLLPKLMGNGQIARTGNGNVKLPTIAFTYVGNKTTSLY